MFRPATTPRRLKCCQPLAYYVTKNNGSFALTLRMTRALAHSAGFSPGDPVRIDIGSDGDACMIRLTKVLSSTRHWHSKGRANQSLYLHATWSGDIEALFPRKDKITGLAVIGISQDDGLTFKSPAHEKSPPTL